jgi:hypothetical protein
MDETTRVECTCKVCTVNATRIGKPVLAAEITQSGIATLSKSGRLSRAAVHGVVHTANHPQLGRALVARRSAYWAA